MSNRHAELTSLLRTLKLQAMADSVTELALKAARANLSHEAFLYELVRLECEQREQRRRERHLRESGLPRDKTFQTLQLGGFSPLIRQQLERLRSGDFVQQAVNVVAVGRPGVGKPQPSHYLLLCERFLICLVAWPVVCSATSVLPHRTMCWQSPASARL